MISVLLPFRDAVRTIADALDSVLADMAPTDELVAVDDGSTDGARRIVEDRARCDRRVVLVRAAAGPGGVGVGVAGALAKAVATSRGELLARMDADDVSLPGRLAEQRALLEADGSLGAVGTRVEAFVDGDATVSDGIARYVAWQNSLVTAAEHARDIHVESPLCHPSTMIRRAALTSVGGFVDTPWPEDWDLWMRLHQAGFGLAKVPEIRLRWRRHAGAVTARDPRCTPERLRDARACYLAKELARTRRPFALWGAGQTGRRLARALEARGARAEFFIDIDPRKKTARERPVLAPDEAMARVRRDALRIVVGVGAPGARATVRGRLMRAGFTEGADFVCAA